MSQTVRFLLIFSVVLALPIAALVWARHHARRYRSLPQDQRPVLFRGEPLRDSVRTWWRLPFGQRMSLLALGMLENVFVELLFVMLFIGAVWLIGELAGLF